MTPNDDAKVRFVHYVTSPIRRWSEFIKQGHVIWNMRMYPVAHVWTRYSPAQSLPQAWVDRTLGTESWSTNKRWLSEEMTGWNQSKHNDQILETKESSSTIIDTDKSVSIVISQRQMRNFNNDQGTVCH